MIWRKFNLVTEEPRWCSHCMQKKPIKGGKYVKLNRLQQAWWCAECIERLAQKTQSNEAAL